MKNNADFLLNDFHIHTYLSECCQDKAMMRPVNIIRKAEDLGYESIGFSDHYWKNGFECIRKIKDDLKELHPGITVLVGCEADLFSETRYSITPEEIRALDLDYVILATSHFHLTDSEKLKDKKPRTAALHWLSFLRAGILSGIADIIPHPVLNLHNALGNMDEIVSCADDEEILEVLKLAGDNEIAMDINPRLFDSPFWSSETQVRFYSLCKRAGVKIAPASDAHNLDEIGDTLKLCEWCGQTGLTRDDFIDRNWLKMKKEKRLKRR